MLHSGEHLNHLHENSRPISHSNQLRQGGQGSIQQTIIVVLIKGWIRTRSKFLEHTSMMSRGCTVDKAASCYGNMIGY